MKCSSATTVITACCIFDMRAKARLRRMPSPMQFELTLCCAVCSADERDVSRIVETHAKQIRWTNLLEVARSHRLDVPLYLALQSQSADLVPSSCLTPLHD